MTGNLGFRGILKSAKGIFKERCWHLYSYTHSETYCSAWFDVIILRIQKPVSITIWPWELREGRSRMLSLYFSKNRLTYATISAQSKSPREANTISATQQMLRILWNVMFHCRVHKSPPLVPIKIHAFKHYISVRSILVSYPIYAQVVKVMVFPIIALHALLISSSFVLSS